MERTKKTGGQLTASLRKLWAMQIKAHSIWTFSRTSQMESSKAHIVFHIPEGAFWLDTALLSQGNPLGRMQVFSCLSAVFPSFKLTWMRRCLWLWYIEALADRWHTRNIHSKRRSEKVAILAAVGAVSR